MKTIEFENSSVPVINSYDTVVNGGGTAGASAAISATREENEMIIVKKIFSLDVLAVGKTICGEQFIVASGDAILSRMSGVPVHVGDDDGYNQMAPYRFEMGGIDVNEYRWYFLEL